MTKKDIQKYLEEGFKEFGTVEKAFDYLLDREIRDLFKMNKWDKPKFYELMIPFKGVNYNIKIKDDGCCETTYDHRIMYWTWEVNAL